MVKIFTASTLRGKTLKRTPWLLFTFFTLVSAVKVTSSIFDTLVHFGFKVLLNFLVVIKWDLLNIISEFLEGSLSFPVFSLSSVFKIFEGIFQNWFKRVNDFSNFFFEILFVVSKVVLEVFNIWLDVVDIGFSLVQELLTFIRPFEIFIGLFDQIFSIIEELLNWASSIWFIVVVIVTIVILIFAIWVLVIIASIGVVTVIGVVIAIGVGCRGVVVVVTVGLWGVVIVVT